MCLFKEKEFKEAKKLNGLITGGIIAIALAIGIPYLTSPGDEVVPKYTMAQFAITSAAFIIILVALCYTISQVRKSMAKPHIKVAFNEKGEQQATLTYKDNRVTNGLPNLWLINEGNAISRYFQIDFIIPENIGRNSSRYVSITVDDSGNCIISNTNDGKYTLFVNKPLLDPNIVLHPAIDMNKFITLSEDSHKIKYRIYGDWAETQEGELKIKVKKQ